MNYFKIIIAGLVLTFLGLNACTQQSQPKKFAVIKYQQETCTFCPGGDAGIEDWTTNGPYLPGDELIGKGHTNLGGYVGGFVHKANILGDVEVVGINSPDFVFGGSSRSWNTLESFEYFMDIILTDLEAKLPVDGVYLALHGAMAVRDIPKPEAEIAKRIRALVGPEVPIVASFDLHGNEDEEFLDWADAAFVTKRFPHYDAFLQGERSAEFLYKASKGMYTPTSASRKPPVITATVLQWTGASPAMDIMERARRWEARNKDVYVSVFYGFPWSDVPDIGTTVHVTTNDDQALADSIADDMAEYIWRVREEYVDQQFPMPKEAVQITKKAIANQQTPVALGDYSDRPGDATWILSELIDEEVEKVLYAALRDEFALEALKEQNAQPGDLFSRKVGGITGEQAGPAVQIDGEVLFFGPQWGYDHVAAIGFGNDNVLIITPTYEQIIQPESLRFGPINPDDFDVFVVKSRVHFRRGFDETGYAKTIQVVDAPGDWFGTIRINALEYEFGPIDQLYPFNTETIDY